MTTVINRRLDWKREPKDPRDHVFRTMFKFPIGPTQLPNSVDLRCFCSEVEDQGELGSCTAQTLVGALEFLAKKNSKKVTQKSRLFAYYNGRRMMFPPMTRQDSGCYMRTVIKAAARYGVCNEGIWPYNIPDFATRPPLSAYTDATKNQIIQYATLKGFNSSETLRNVLETLARGYPVCFGFDVFPSMLTEAVAKSGYVPMPNLQNEEIQGGHATLIVGYDLMRDMLLVRNSWGKKWGIDGYFWLPMWFIRSGHADDFWVVEAQEYDESCGWLKGLKGWLSMHKSKVVSACLLGAVLTVLSGCTSTKFEMKDNKWTMDRQSFLQKLEMPKIQIHTNGTVEVVGYANDGGNQALETIIKAAVEAGMKAAAGGL